MAFGLSNLTAGLLVLPGAMLFGTLWEAFGSGVAFTVAAAVTGIAGSVLAWFSRPVAH